MRLSSLTGRAVQRQIAGLASVTHFELGIRCVETGRFFKRIAERHEVANKYVPWLRRMNTQNSDIYIRPSVTSPHRYLLLDDLELEAIECMERDGFWACLILETSTDNYQVLLPLPINFDVSDRKLMERNLADRYGSDPNSCDGQHFFRLAGFVNKKPEHSRYGEIDGPWVYCRASRPAARLSASAWEWLESCITQPSRGNGSAAERSTPLSTVTFYKSPVSMQIDCRDAELIGSLSRLKAYHLPNCDGVNGPDQSRAEWRACAQLIRQGANPDSLAEALSVVAERKLAYARDYAERTVTKIVSQLSTDLSAKG